MSTPPEASTEYSRGSGVFRGLRELHRRPDSASPPKLAEVSGAPVAGVAAGALIAALLLIVSQFTPLYHVHSIGGSTPIKTVGTGANHAYAPIPLALLAIWFALTVTATGSRAALLGLSVLGLTTLGVALLGDLPDAHASGLIGSNASPYVQAASTPSAGLYMETLAAVLLLISGGVGLLMFGRRPAPARGPRAGLSGADR